MSKTQSQAVAARLDRRGFLLTTGAAAAAFSLVPRHVLGGPRFVAPSEKVNIALVGAGGQGRSNLQGLFLEKDAQVVAVADPVQSVSLEDFYYKGTGGRSATRTLIEKQYQGKDPQFRCVEYDDFRVMLEKEKGLDAVLCATPDHLHACVSVLSMRAGKHVYCEKPLTHNLWEARLVAKVAKETGVATQMGNQGHSTEGIRLTREWVAAGAIGAVREVHAWVRTSRWNPTLTGRPTETPPVPAGFNWDLWLGPREPRPYHPAYVPVKWRDFWAFGGGGLGDFGCHDMDPACWALDLAAPETIEARGAGPTNAEIVPHGCLVYYRFPARDKHPPVKLVWHDGGLMPERPEAIPEDEPLPSRGSIFYGEKGVMLGGGLTGKPRLYPESLDQSFQRPAPTIARSKGHHRDWLDACKGGPPASSNFEYGARLTEITLLGILSLRVGKRIHWDAANLKAKGLPAADPIIREPYRKEWEIA